ncbi:flagellar export protein FliJ [Aquabacterium sp. A08]|uniref:flagellar export protein FliJ n=1 Tax=Aquabacterium sp. A08 TaxID=2718532 RepID=UPI001423F55F|nr:flagellar export protein FliJ [Aquabacterium sp. A08]NIC41931.1 flagellar export protein FliJ [Aquabacterium sp. A08]NIC41974.1 flagellar export protein FliJ [Aquabacterium sp. A08]
MSTAHALDTVVEVATRRRDEALQALGRAQREHQQAQGQLVQLQDYTRESLQRWQQRAGQGISPTLLRTQQTFMGKLDHAVAFQHGVLQRLQLHIDHCREQLLQAERELASLTKYLERRHQAQQHRLQRQDQKSNDEMAANQHRQHSAAHPWKSTP